MQNSSPLPGLRAIASEFDGILCDVWGVLHNGQKVFPQAIEALRTYKDERTAPVILITNAPRPAHEIQEHLDRLGVPRDCYDGIVSSGGATQALLQQDSEIRIYHIGPDKNLGLFDGVNHTLVPAEEADVIVCSGLNNREVEHPEDYRSQFESLLKLDLPLICANPDVVAEDGDKLVWCGGALAQLYDRIGGKTVITGKPFLPIYENAMALLQKHVHAPLQKDRILTIGDGLPTDIKGAMAAGLAALFITDGIHAKDLAGRPEAVAPRLEQEELVAHAFMGRLAW